MAHGKKNLLLPPRGTKVRKSRGIIELKEKTLSDLLTKNIGRKITYFA